MSAPLPRRVCPACRALTPSTAPACAQCGRRFGNESVRHAVIIVLVFAASYTVWFLIHLL